MLTVDHLNACRSRSIRGLLEALEGDLMCFEPYPLVLK